GPLNCRDSAPRVELIDHSADHLPMKLDGHPDYGLRSPVTPRPAGFVRDHELGRLWIADNGFHLVVVGSEDGLRQTPAQDVLQQTMINGKVVITSIPIQDLYGDGYESKEWPQHIIQE